MMNHTRTSLTLAILVTLGLSAPAMAQSADRSTSQTAAADSDQPGTDTWITTKVKADLLASGKTPGTDISVETKNGVVWLSGTVATQAQKERAVTEAKGIEGVKKVDASKLKVSSAMAAEGMKHDDTMEHGSMDRDAESDQPGTDTWITTKVKADLLASGKTSGTDISVETTNGVVWLSGTVATQAEKDQAVTEAKGIEGVKKVDASKLKVANKM
jgi:hyperosmotically inducible protein